MSTQKKRGRGHEEAEHDSSERWMISYADMLTLLLALFIVMFAISKVDAAKFKEFAQGTAEYFGEATMALNGTDGILDGQGTKPYANPNANKATESPEVIAKKALAREQARKSAANAEMQSLTKVRDQIAAQLTARGLKNAVQFQLDERGLVVNIVTDKVLFDTGKADLRPDGVKVLDIIAPSVKSLPNRVTVEGHTDNVPITSGAFASNWELSTTRATTVVRRMVADGLHGDQVSAAGYADQRPLDTNRTDAGRARNRRVAIVVLPQVKTEAEIEAAVAAQPEHTTPATPATTAPVSPVTAAPHPGA